MFRFIYVAVFVAMTFSSAPLSIAASGAFQAHMANMLTDGDEWYTPNPDYSAGEDVPAEYGLRMELSEDRTHVVGVMEGIYADGRRTPYWTLLALYNPITEKVITLQIGWDGSLVRGEVPVQVGDEQTIDTILYGSQGNLKSTRHVQRFAGDHHQSLVYERNEQGEWALLQTWEWKRRALDVAPEPIAGKPPTKEDDPLLRDVGYLLSGSGRWRTDNINYEEGGDMPRQFDMNYRWGPYGRHVIGEIVSIYADGRMEKDWTQFITHNPVTGQSYMEQTGGKGVYFRGELSHGENGHHIQKGLIYMPSGRVKPVRDEDELIDENTRFTHVYERDESGEWDKVRLWKWRQLQEQE